jgi:hypothetical protein
MSCFASCALAAAEDGEDFVQGLWFRIAAAPPTPMAEPVGY